MIDRSTDQNSETQEATVSTQPVKRANLSATIAERLKREIESGQRKPGDQLPGHRELATIFSVSVGSVREAISMLVSAGLIEARAGRGTFVAIPDEAALKDAPVPIDPPHRKDIAQLIEAREVLELQIVTMAAERASAESIERLRAALAQMAASVSDAQAYCQADLEFHLALAEAAGNIYLVRAMKDVRAHLESDFELSVDAAVRRFGSVGFSVEQHGSLVEAIEAGNGEGARTILFELMGRNHEFLRSLYSFAAPREAAGVTGT